MSLNAKQAKFVELVLTGMPGSHAYASAYGLPVSPSTEVGSSRLLKHPGVRAAIAAARGEAPPPADDLEFDDPTITHDEESEMTTATLTDAPTAAPAAEPGDGPPTAHFETVRAALEETLRTLEYVTSVTLPTPDGPPEFDGPYLASGLGLAGSIHREGFAHFFAAATRVKEQVSRALAVLQAGVEESRRPSAGRPGPRWRCWTAACTRRPGCGTSSTPTWPGSTATRPRPAGDRGPYHPEETSP